MTDEMEDRVDRALSILLRQKSVEIIRGPHGEEAFKLTEKGIKEAEEILRTNPIAHEFYDNLNFSKVKK